jgi:hypothetical protein
MSTIHINSTGINHIRQFLADNHKLGGDHFDDDMLAAWAADVERNYDEQGEAEFEIRGMDSASGNPVICRLSSDGYDADEASEELQARFAAHLPDGVDLADCELTTYGDERISVAGAGIDSDTPALILPGWIADDGNAEVEYPDAESGAEAAQEYVDDGSWGDLAETSWVNVTTWRPVLLLLDGETEWARADQESHTITLEAEEPDCADGEEHDWRSPHSVLGGLEDDPGVQGHGGGVIITEVCAHCGAYRVTDTWAQDMSTGEQGLTSVEYRDADDDSLEWVEALRVRALRETVEGVLDQMDSVAEYIYGEGDELVGAISLVAGAETDSVVAELQLVLGDDFVVSQDDSGIIIERA